ncbi:MAG: DUF1080 domain-containing protein [Verrucomicrobiales bacterium]|nr:DUF1080 domain-containing protein [Verrucomicrobiales bacterium]
MKGIRRALVLAGLGTGVWLLVLGLVGFDLNAADKDGDGFVAMFNGKDLSGWKTEGNWVVEADGTVALKPREGEKGWQRFKSYIWSEKQYGDFVIQLEYKYEKTGNSGLFFRVGDMDDPVKTGMEVQILDTYGKPEAVTPHDSGGLIGAVGPSKNVTKPAGEWNQLVVTAKGNTLKVVLNGVQVIDADLATTKAKDKPVKGYLGFQDEAKLLWYRNVRIKEL